MRASTGPPGPAMTPSPPFTVGSRSFTRKSPPPQFIQFSGEVCLRTKVMFSGDSSPPGNLMWMRPSRNGLWTALSSHWKGGGGVGVGGGERLGVRGAGREREVSDVTSGAPRWSPPASTPWAALSTC